MKSQYRPADGDGEACGDRPVLVPPEDEQVKRYPAPTEPIISKQVPALTGQLAFVRYEHAGPSVAVVIVEQPLSE